MTKMEFLNQLRAYLYTLPPGEQEAAMEFYTEYFDDAGPENEQKVITELGSPQKVARQILKGCDERYIPPAYAPVPRRRSGFPWWMILLIVVGFPVWFPLLAAAVVLALVLVLVAVILAAALAVTVAALVFSGIAGMFVWIAGLGGVTFPYVDLPGGMIGLGVVLSCLGLGLLLLWPITLLFSRGIPLIIGWIGGVGRRFCNWLRRKRI